MQLDASIFKAYDIRGVVPSTVNEQVAEALGKAFGSLACAQGERRVAPPRADPHAVGMPGDGVSASHSVGASLGPLRLSLLCRGTPSSGWGLSR